MSLVVVDASILVAFYASDDPRRGAVADRLSVGNALFAPAHLDAEVLSALRRLSRTSSAVEKAVSEAVRHLARFPFRRMPLSALMERVWELWDNLTPYGAAYVTLAERLRAPLITCDAKLAAAHGPRCTFDLIH